MVQNGILVIELKNICLKAQTVQKIILMESCRKEGGMGKNQL